jgi:hypothetical protein
MQLGTSTANVQWHLLAVRLSVLTAFGSEPVKAAPAAKSAVWMPHDVVVSLQDLPHRYSRDQLSRKFRAVPL